MSGGTSTAIATSNMKGIIQSVDKGCCLMFGYSFGELTGQPISKLIPSPYREQHDSYLTNYHRTGKAKIIGRRRVVEAQHKDGSIFPITLSVSEVKAGSNTLYIGMMQKVLDESLTLTIKCDGTIINCVGNCEKLFGLKRGEMMGNNLTMIMPNPHRSRHAQYVENYFKTGLEKAIGKVRNVPAQHKNGIVFPISLQVSKIVNENGEINFVGRIERVEEERETIFNLNNSGIIESCNKNFILPLTGYTEEEVKGKHINMLMPSLYHHISNPKNQILKRKFCDVDQTAVKAPSMPNKRPKEDSDFFIYNSESSGSDDIDDFFEQIINLQSNQLNESESNTPTSQLDNANTTPDALPQTMTVDVPITPKPISPPPSHSPLLVPSSSISPSPISPSDVITPSFASAYPPIKPKLPASVPTSHPLTPSTPNQSNNSKLQYSSHQPQQYHAGSAIHNYQAVNNNLHPHQINPLVSNYIATHFPQHNIPRVNIMPKPSPNAPILNVNIKSPQLPNSLPHSPAPLPYPTTPLPSNTLYNNDLINNVDNQNPQEEAWIIIGTRFVECIHKDGSSFTVSLTINKYVNASGEIKYSGRVKRVSQSTSASYQPNLNYSDSFLIHIGNFSYDAQCTLGCGSYGKVYLGKMNETNQLVAVKVLNKQQMDETELFRAKREISIMRTLNHPHICRLLDSYETSEFIYIIMEYCTNGELLSFIHKKSRLTEQEAKYFFAQLASAVKYCHENHIIHRDIKHKNILLDDNFQVKLIDFGLSNYKIEGGWRETYCGTPAYSSPEMILSQKYSGPEVDIWSMGVVLYTMLTKQFPFKNVSDIITGKFEFPHYLTHECCDLLSRMLKVDQKERATIDEIIGHSFLVGVPVNK